MSASRIPTTVRLAGGVIASYFPHSGEVLFYDDRNEVSLFVYQWGTKKIDCPEGVPPNAQALVDQYQARIRRVAG